MKRMMFTILAAAVVAAGLAACSTNESREPKGPGGMDIESKEELRPGPGGWLVADGWTWTQKRRDLFDAACVPVEDERLEDLLYIAQKYEGASGMSHCYLVRKPETQRNPFRFYLAFIRTKGEEKYLESLYALYEHSGLVGWKVPDTITVTDKARKAFEGIRGSIDGNFAAYALLAERRDGDANYYKLLCESDDETGEGAAFVVVTTKKDGFDVMPIDLSGARDESADPLVYLFEGVRLKSSDWTVPSAADMHLDEADKKAMSDEAKANGERRLYLALLGTDKISGDRCLLAAAPDKDGKASSYVMAYQTKGNEGFTLGKEKVIVSTGDVKFGKTWKACADTSLTDHAAKAALAAGVSSPFHVMEQLAYTEDGKGFLVMIEDHKRGETGDVFYSLVYIIDGKASYSDIHLDPEIPLE